MRPITEVMEELLEVQDERDRLRAHRQSLDSVLHKAKLDFDEWAVAVERSPQEFSMEKTRRDVELAPVKEQSRLLAEQLSALKRELEELLLERREHVAESMHETSIDFLFGVVSTLESLGWSCVPPDIDGAA